MNRHAVLGLIGKGVFASAAVVLMFGGEQNANAVQPQQLSTGAVEYRTATAQPAAVPTVRASSDQQSSGRAQQRWVF